MYTTIVFDFFDVINTDPYKNWLRRYRVETHGGYKEVQNNMDSGRIDLQTFFKKLSELSGQSIETVTSEYESTKLVDRKIVSLVRDLRKNYKIGLLSNAPSEYIRSLLKEHDLEKLFDAISVSSETELLKPSREAFVHILNSLNATPDQTIFIDDKEQNTNAADSLGITSIHFKNTKQLVDKLLGLGIKM